MRWFLPHWAILSYASGLKRLKHNLNFLIKNQPRSIVSFSKELSIFDIMFDMITNGTWDFTEALACIDWVIETSSSCSQNVINILGAHSSRQQLLVLPN